MIEPFAARQLKSNRDTRDAWERCANHREKVSDLLLDAAPTTPGSLCVLGGGNCNDIDLRRLQAAFGQIHLVDLDLEALTAGVTRQGPLDRSAVYIHAPCDLTGILQQLHDPYERLIDTLRRCHPSFPGCPYDVVLSAGVITQMFQSVEDAGHPHEATMQLVLEVRRQHLRVALDLTRAGGAFVLISDAVSSGTAPDLPTLPADRLAQRLKELIDARNFFTGANPVAVQHDLAAQPDIAPAVAAATFHEPWLWPLTRSCSYLVWAVTIRKQPGSYGIRTM